MDTIHPNSSGDISTGGWKKGSKSNFPRKDQYTANVRFVVLCPIFGRKVSQYTIGRPADDIC
jgi:hypothetical protein